MTVGRARVTQLLAERLAIEPNRSGMSRKTRTTYYTAGKVAAARLNVQTYEWAKRLCAAAVSKADSYLAAGYDYLWEAVPAQTLPRSYGVNQILGSAVTGKAIDQYGNYPYLADPLNEPWKIVDPSCGLKFPTNDFAAYYRSGLDERGIFRTERADRSLLVNTLYPEKGPDWGVDDGFGWVDDSGNTYTFIAYYVHWYIWYGSSALIEDALRTFRDAFLYTGDRKYAVAGVIVLDRVADVYPDMDISAYNRDVFLNSDGRKNTGKIIGSIWETSLVKTFISAYDAFFPAMDDPEIISYLSEKSLKAGLANPKRSGADIRCNIEDGIIKQIFPAVQKAQICGNDGMHQSALVMAAVVYDTMPETKLWLDFVFQTGGLAREPFRVTGGNVLNSLVSHVDRDGHGNEASPGYNGIWLAYHRLTADILDGYDLYPEADLYTNAKFRKMFSAFYPLILSGKYTVNVGDTAAAGNPYMQVKLDDMVKAFDAFGEPIYARMAFFLNHNRAEGLHLDVFSSDPERIADRIAGVIAEYGPLEMESGHLSGYGFAALRDGRASEKTMRDCWLYYGRNTGHGHRDTLNIGLHAFGLDLTPDLGYPEYADIFDMHRAHWVINTISHNTVVVDKRMQEPSWVALPKHFDDSRHVKWIDVEASGVYPQTESYRRKTTMIRVDDTDSYVVDMFRVRGGNDHHFSFHGAEGTVTTEGLTPTVQQSGTYAGTDIAYGQRADNGSGGYEKSGFHYLKNIERHTEPVSRFSVEWSVQDTWNIYGQGAAAETDVHLRLTMLTDVSDVAIADGIPPQNKPGNPKTLRYMIAHREGTNLDSLFVSVLEPYKGRRFIASIERVDIWLGNTLVADNEAAAVKVSLISGRVDYIIHAANPDLAYTIDGKLEFQGYFGVYSEQDGVRQFAYMHDATRLGCKGSDEDTAAIAMKAEALTGTIESFTRDLSVKNELIVNMDAGESQPSDWVGKTIFVDNDGKRNAVYPIQGAERLKDGRYRLDIGDMTLIRGFAAEDDFDQGYRYDIEVGATFRIPLTLVLE
ncbi:heparinase II/III domain-containing protein [Paenibacillus ginsengarvi]|uniref:Heparinase II/III-like C-terminal domain-containing protein n=1 Tax=Paenibacillus ginsengarvi TaxID=400777 RepID=A0A3B0CFW2_9BACL|nr:heparinase II/III family protein [Paenibacillus ginsengarvi]RKN84292.1 hypothetical protein D7M11_14945 [Paenibacillus ginsengarvi]